MKKAAFESVEDTADERPEYQEPEVAEETEAPAEESVPDGTVKEILEWVGDDKDRAQRALDAEEAKGNSGRKGLKRELNEKIEN
jgi:hypothetical protein